MRSMLHRWTLGALLLLTAVCYAPSLRGPFFFDDQHFVVDNPLVHSLANVPKLYATSVTEGTAERSNFYRPNQQLAYSLIYAAVGDATPVPYHVLPLLLHLINGVLLLAWLRTLGIGRWPALAATALFLLHPVQTQAISYISGLSEPLALAFGLGATLALTAALSREPANWRRSGPLVVALTALALLSKESAVSLLPVTLAVTLAVGRRTGRSTPNGARWTLAAVAALTLAYAAAKLTILSFTGGFGLSGDANAYTASLAVRLMTFASNIWDYAVLLVAPTSLTYEKPYLAYTTLATPRGAFGIAVLLAALATLAGWRRRPRLALGVAIVAATLALFTGIIPLNSMLLEHWLYAPMVGIALLAALALERLAATRLAKPALAAAPLLLLVLAAWRTSARAADWADPERFYLHELDAVGPTVRALNNLGLYYASHDQPAKAIDYYRYAATLPDARALPQPHYNLARMLAAVGQMDEATTELHQALAADHGFVPGLDLLHEIYVVTGRPDLADAVSPAAAAARDGRAYDFAALEAALFAPPAPQPMPQ